MVMLVMQREDLLFFGYDMRPFDNDSGVPVMGVTFASPKFYRKHVNPTEETQFYATFRGSDNHPLAKKTDPRQQLKKSFSHTHIDGVDFELNVRMRFPINELGDFVVPWERSGAQELLPGMMSFLSTGDPSANLSSSLSSPDGREVPYDDLFNSSFVLVPRGHGRWSYRLSEAIGACAVPVVIADGLTLPYEQLIDWQYASVRIPEAYAESASMLVDALPKDAVKIRRMRQEVCVLNRRYFDTMEKRGHALLESAAVQGDVNARRTR